MKQIKIAIVGTGPSGIYCALQLIEEFQKTAFEAYSVTFFDPLPTLSTILPTGNGRCNLTYAEEDFKTFASNYPRGEKFLYSIFSRYLTEETLEYFKKIGVKTFVQPDNRVFPVSESAKTVRTQMISALEKRKDVKICQKTVKKLEELDEYDVTVLATGSKDRYNLARQYGHTVIPIKPVLCGLKIKDKAEDFPAGVSIHTENGGIIFTHTGFSGPEIFKISSINAKKSFPYEVKIPIISSDKVFELIDINPKKSFGNVISELIPKSAAKYLFKKYGIDFDKQAAHARKEEIEKLQYLEFTATGPDGKGEIVHAGGVSLDEINKNCRSKICPKLWVIGEALDIDGFCGGFNLQNCWSTAAIAAQDIVKNFTTET
ncbi:MAG: aminoacetone oxidase family FAD-binding enzyme [Candidatus Gastranaerophilales bacterium]|nr:aminoacetone oxidase family FAD-binding enzyme [Candidatus Gastranaerophilales bacterium]